MKARRLRKPISYRHPEHRCVHPVRMAQDDTLTRRIRVHAAHKGGFPPDQCGKPATIAIDEVTYCDAHAGQVALRALLADTGSAT